LRFRNSDFAVPNRHSAIRNKVGAVPGVRKGKLIRLSAARAKVRSGYASVLQVCVSGFMAGVVLFVISAGIHFCVSITKNWFAVSEGFPRETKEVSEFFRLQVFDGKSASGAAMNLGLISVVFGALGIMAGIILRYTIRKEPSECFFRRKIRIPFDFLPFFAFFIYACLQKRDFIGLYLVATLAVGYLWRFWHRVVLSVVSSLDVNRFIPKPL